MSEKHTPLEEFEFRQAARIRNPEEKCETPKSGKKCLFAIAGITIVFLCAAAAAGFFYSQLQQEQLKRHETEQQLSTLRKEKSAAENELKEIRQQLEKMAHRLSTSSKGKGELMASIDSLKQDIESRDRTIRALKQKAGKNTNLIKELNREQRKTEFMLQNEKKLNQELQQQISIAKKDILTYQDQISGLKRVIQNLQNNMNQEGNASRKLVADMLDAQNEAANLKKEKTKLETGIKKLKAEIISLKQVHFGKLVPFSNMVKKASPIIHPAAMVEKKGIFGKVKGFVLVNAYIDETGFVQNAFYLECHLNKEEANSEAISQALKTVLKWRFSPALYNGKTPVKVWQPIAVPVESK
ncbi:MAG: hypothetical protein GXO69_11335 [Acidobacteria bacterium]|nr:hypothetical protein [Acidobacteriota bacterium]